LGHVWQQVNAIAAHNLIGNGYLHHDNNKEKYLSENMHLVQKFIIQMGLFDYFIRLCPLQNGSTKIWHQQF